MAAPDSAGGRPPAELRIAVAMRGGVSLAVWMGGACSEIVRLRNATPDGTDPYSRLLKILGYDKVTVDVISGSSAGGLNGVLLALHLAYGMPFGTGVRDLWLRLGDLEQLTRSPSAPQPVSVLTGDEPSGFYGRLRRACDELLRHATPGRPPENLRLVLTATRLHSRTVRMHQTLGEPLHAGRAKAYFRFGHRAVNGAAPVVTDFPARQRDHVTDLLAYAARTSSSFPGAFEPARIRVAPGEPDFDGPDFQRLSSETGAGDDGGATVELIDGGLLDNIPIAWAIRAIAGAPADRPVDRWLLYLQPVEPVTAAKPVPPKERRVTRLVRLLVKSAGRRMDSESLLDDAAELHAAAAAAHRVRGIAATGVPEDPDTVLRDSGRRAAYRRLVGLAEGDRIARLAEDPATVLGPDPLPLPAARPAVGTEVFNGLHDPATVAALAAAATPAAGAPGVRTPFGVARAVALLLDWVRATESCGQLPPKTAEVVRERLYSARLAAELLVGVRDRMLLPHLGAAATAADVVDLVRRTTWRLAAAVPPGWRIPDRSSWPDWRDALLGLLAVPELRTSHPPADGWPDEVFAAFWDELARIGLTVGRGLDPEAAGPAGFERLRTATDVAAVRDCLAAAELILGPVRPDPFTEPTGVKFHALTASRHNPVERLVFGDPLDAAARAEAKLSGNQLSNFAAFLSARWRHADWIWGRLDAVPSLVELLLADRSRLTRLKPDELLSELQALYLADPSEADISEAGPGGGGSDAGGSGSEQAAGLAEQWAAHAVTVDNVREKFADVVTERLQRDILTAELPVLERLQARGRDRDLPPRPDLLQGPTAGPDLPQDPPPEPELLHGPPPEPDLSHGPPPRPALLHGRGQPAGRDLPHGPGRPHGAPTDPPPPSTLAAVGREQPRELLGRAHTRRAATRMGLVGWRALQPAGSGLKARLARRLFGLGKPLVLLPALAALTSPVGALVAALGGWLLVAAVAGVWSSPLTQPVLAAGFALAAGIAGWRLAGAKGWGRAGWAAAGAGVCLVGGAVLAGLGADQLWADPTVRYAAILLGALTGIAPYGWLSASRSKGVAALVSMFLLLSLVALGAIALTTMPARLAGTGLDGATGWLSGPPLALLALYGVLTVPTVVLTWAFPTPPGRPDH